MQRRKDPSLKHRFVNSQIISLSHQPAAIITTWSIPLAGAVKKRQSFLIAQKKNSREIEILAKASKMHYFGTYKIQVIFEV